MTVSQHLPPELSSYCSPSLWLDRGHLARHETVENVKKRSGHIHIFTHTLSQTKLFVALQKSVIKWAANWRRACARNSCLVLEDDFLCCVSQRSVQRQSAITALLPTCWSCAKKFSVRKQISSHYCHLGFGSRRKNETTRLWVWPWNTETGVLNTLRGKVNGATTLGWCSSHCSSTSFWTSTGRWHRVSTLDCKLFPSLASAQREGRGDKYRVMV